MKTRLAAMATCGHLPTVFTGTSMLLCEPVESLSAIGFFLMKLAPSARATWSSRWSLKRVKRVCVCGGREGVHV